MRPLAWQDATMIAATACIIAGSLLGYLTGDYSFIAGEWVLR